MLCFLKWSQTLHLKIRTPFFLPNLLNSVLATGPNDTIHSMIKCLQHPHWVYWGKKLKATGKSFYFCQRVYCKSTNFGVQEIFNSEFGVGTGLYKENPLLSLKFEWESKICCSQNKLTLNQNAQEMLIHGIGTTLGILARRNIKIPNLLCLNTGPFRFLSKQGTYAPKLLPLDVFEKELKKTFMIIGVSFGQLVLLTLQIHVYKY